MDSNNSYDSLGGYLGTWSICVMFFALLFGGLMNNAPLFILSMLTVTSIQLWCWESFVNRDFPPIGIVSTILIVALGWFLYGLAYPYKTISVNTNNYAVAEFNNCDIVHIGNEYAVFSDIESERILKSHPVIKRVSSFNMYGGHFCTDLNIGSSETPRLRTVKDIKGE